MKLEDKCKRYIIKSFLNVYCEIFGSRSYGGDALTRKLVRPSPYELMPNISQYTFNNL